MMIRETYLTNKLVNYKCIYVFQTLTSILSITKPSTNAVDLQFVNSLKLLKTMTVHNFRFELTQNHSTTEVF